MRAIQRLALLTKQAKLDPVTANALGVGGVGALAGGAIGGLSGLVSPGYYEKNEYDKDGIKFTRRMRRSRLGAALGNALNGAAAFGLGGAALGGMAAEGSRFIPTLGYKIRSNQLQKAIDETPLGLELLKLKGEKFTNDLTGQTYANLPRKVQMGMLDKPENVLYNNFFSRLANKVVGSKQ